MNIPELKEAMDTVDIILKVCEHTNRQHLDFEDRQALQTLLSACQLLCDVSDKMLPKKETSGFAHKDDKDRLQRISYNLARSEDILWLTKKMMGGDIEGICEKVHKAYCKYHLENKGTEYWTKGDYNKLTDEGKEYDRRTVRAVIDAIRQEMGGGE